MTESKLLFQPLRRNAFLQSTTRPSVRPAIVIRDTLKLKLTCARQMKDEFGHKPETQNDMDMKPEAQKRFEIWDRGRSSKAINSDFGGQQEQSLALVEWVLVDSMVVCGAVR